MPVTRAFALADANYIKSGLGSAKGRELRLKLIETYLPLEALARAAANETRAGVGAPSSLHLWWGNRQVAIAKGLVFAQLVDAPEFGDIERTNEVHGVLAGLLNGDPLVEPRARELIRESCGGEWPTAYDPFCGVGTVPFAALALGVPAIGGELNPVAAFVARLATGAERSELNEFDLRKAVNWTQTRLATYLKELYPPVKITPSMAKGRPDVAKYVGRTLPVEMWLWVRTVPDPSPAFGGCPVPLVSNYVTGAKSGRESWVDVELLKSKKDYRFVVRSGPAPEGKSNGTRLGSRADFVSIFDGRPITGEYIRAAGQAGKLGVRLMAIFAQGDDGEKVVLSPTKEQERVVREVEGQGGDIPLPDNARDTKAASFGFKTYGDLFLPRQKRMLTELGRILANGFVKGKKVHPVASVLTLAYSQFVSWNSMANTYWNERQFPRNVFTRQSLPFAWDFVEANPIEASTKRWEEVARGVVEKYLALPRVGAGRIACEDATAAKLEEPAVVNTELPYYDNVAYADLADFFYAWTRPVFRRIAPDLAVNLASPRAEELTAFAYRHGGRAQADAFYQQGVAKALKRIRQNCREDYPAVFSFDFRSATFSGRDIKPVAAFVEGLVGAGFTITAAWPLKDMRTQAVFGGDAGTGFRSIYFVCRPARVGAEVVTHRQFSDYLRQKLPGAIGFYREMDRGIEPNDKASIAFVAGIRLFSQFARVLNADGSIFPVAEVIEEVLRIADELDRGGPVEKVQGDNLRETVVARIKRGENPAGIRKEIYDSYLKFEDAGQTELASKYNDLLNEWYDLIEEMTK